MQKALPGRLRLILVAGEPCPFTGEGGVILVRLARTIRAVFVVFGDGKRAALRKS